MQKVQRTAETILCDEKYKTTYDFFTCKKDNFVAQILQPNHIDRHNSKFLENITNKITNVYIYHYILIDIINKKKTYFKFMDFKGVLTGLDTFCS